jgi:hypothetical protein
MAFLVVETVNLKTNLEWNKNQNLENVLELKQQELYLWDHHNFYKWLNIDSQII